ncbi:MAG: glycosyltransferase family 9 protein, partial [Ktedonobacterales bacterium]
MSMPSLDLAFLHECGLNPARALTDDERRRVRAVHAEVAACDSVVFHIGGRAGRLGECVVATALLEGFLLALAALGKRHLPVRIAVEGAAAELFDARLYRALHWPEIEVRALLTDGMEQVTTLVEEMPGDRALIVDFHGGHDGMPTLDVVMSDDRRISILARLFRTGVRSYAAHGPARRYAAAIEALLALPPGTVDSLRAQPTVLLSHAERSAYPALAWGYGLRPGARPIVGFFQSVVVAKCYGRREEVLGGICADFATRFPGSQHDIVLACGPDDQNPEGVRFDDLQDEFTAFTGVRGNARMHVVRTPSLRELAVLLTQALLALSNDTGPGHIAGALGVPTVTPYLPGNVYSKRIWSSTLWHRGITLDPNPYTHEQVKAAV